MELNLKIGSRVFYNFLFFMDYLLLSNYSPIVKVIGSAEAGYIIALVAGIVITNLIKIPSWLKQYARGELFIKTAIVILGAKILLTTFLKVPLPS